MTTPARVRIVDNRFGHYVRDDLAGSPGMEAESLLAEGGGSYLDGDSLDVPVELDERDTAGDGDGDGKAAKDPLSYYIRKLKLCRVLDRDGEVGYAKAKDAARDAAIVVCADAGYPLGDRKDNAGNPLKDNAGNTLKKTLPNPGKFWEYVDETRPKLSSEQAAMLEKHIDEMQAAEAALVESCLPLVVWWMTKKRHVRPSCLPDYVDAGNSDLYSAVYKFNWRRGYRLSTYASKWVERGFLRQRKKGYNGSFDVPDYFSQLMKRVSDSISQNKHRGNMDPDADEVMEISGGSMGSVKRAMRMFGKGVLHIDSCLGEDGDGASLDLECVCPPSEPLETAEDVARLNEAMGQLEPREREILERRVGMNGYDNMTLEDIGEQIGLTRERVRQIERDAKKKLKNIMENSYHLAMVAQ